MKKVLTLLVVLAMIVPLAACGSNGKQTLTVYNAGSYIDKTTISDFEKEYNCNVVYDEYNSPEDCYVKVAKSDTPYDVVCVCDYMIDRMIQEGLLAKLDKSQIPNLSGISPDYLAPSYDPNNDYSVPYMVGTLGILYNKTMVSSTPTSWGCLWDPQYSGNILMIDAMREAIGVTANLLGYSMSTDDDSQLAAIKQKLIDQKPLVQAYTADDTPDKMIAGEAALSVYYSGEAYGAIQENPDLDYVIPEEGSSKWVDAWTVLKTSKEQTLANEFINFMSSTDIAVRNMTETGYTSAVSAAWASFDDNPIMFPSSDVLSKCQTYSYSADATVKYNDLWTAVRSQ